MRWENTKPLNCIGFDKITDINKYAPYKPGERRFCAFTGIDIYDDCYIIEIADPETKNSGNIVFYQIIVSPVGYHRYFKANVYNYNVYRTKSPVTLNTILTEQTDEKTRKMLIDLDRSITQIGHGVWKAVINGEEIRCLCYYDLSSLTININTYKDYRILYIKSNMRHDDDL
jgi:hypothetical protein